MVNKKNKAFSRLTMDRLKNVLTQASPSETDQKEAIRPMLHNYAYVNVGTIDYADFNSAGWESTDVDIVFTGTKLPNTYVSQLFFDTTQAFETDPSSYSNNEIKQIGLGNDIDINTVTTMPLRGKGNIVVNVVLNGSNNRNWIRGSINVYAELKEYPQF